MIKLRRFFPVWITRVLFRAGLLKVTQWPTPPVGALARVLYVKVDDPQIGMVCYRFSDGSLIPIGQQTQWIPTDKWRFERDQPC